MLFEVSIFGAYLVAPLWIRAPFPLAPCPSPLALGGAGFDRHQWLAPSFAFRDTLRRIFAPVWRRFNLQDLVPVSWCSTGVPR